MALERITQVSGTGVFIPGSDIDTDRIIPARFMKCVTFDGLGEYLFYDVRKTGDGTDKAHPLNEPRHAEASILLAGINFGCGSSREHAPQALYRYGFRALIAESFAEIFFGNCTTLGIPCVIASAEQIAQIRAEIEIDPETPITIDVTHKRVHFGDQSISVEMPETARGALIHGKWDAIGELLEGSDDIDRTVSSLAYVQV
ncbi:MAG: 3-isopropylmalate dehydratase small subunit [Verrucomicrobiota bacterium]